MRKWLRFDERWNDCEREWSLLCVGKKFSTVQFSIIIMIFRVHCYGMSIIDNVEESSKRRWKFCSELSVKRCAENFLEAENFYKIELFDIFLFKMAKNTEKFNYNRQLSQEYNGNLIRI